MNGIFKPVGAPASLAGLSGVGLTLNLDFSGFAPGAGLGFGFGPGLTAGFGAAPATGSPAIEISVGTPIGARNDLVMCVRSPGSACSCGKT